MVWNNSTFALTFTLMLLRYHVFVRQPDGLQVEWNTYVAPFSWSVWLIVVLLVLLIALLLTAIYRLGRSHGLAEAVAEDFRFRDSVFYVLGAFCQQGACLFC